MDKTTYKQIVFANTAEAFEDILNSAGNTEEGQKRIRHELALSQRAFFWEDDNKVIITPTQIPKELFELNCKLLSYKTTVNYFPDNVGLNLSKSVNVQRLSETISKDSELIISPYAITPGFLELFNLLLGDGFKVKVDNLPVKGGYDLVRYLDSKSGFRIEMEKLVNNGVNVPMGFVCQSTNDLSARIKLFENSNKRFVVKADQGESGWGLIISNQGQNDTNQIIHQVTTETIWSDGPFIIEEYIEVDDSIAGGSPSAELNITDDTVEITYLCGQIVQNGEFQGTIVGAGIIPPEIEQQMVRIANIIGNHYKSLGYRGIFDIDYVVSKQGVTYAVETNARRTGGTHVYDLAKRLIGKNYIDHIFVSNDHFEYSNQNESVNAILGKTSRELYSKNSRTGIVITLINQKDHILGYVAIGNTLLEATDIAEKFKKLLA